MIECKQKKTVLCICINYYTEEETALLAADFLAQNGENSLRCIVIDNSLTIQKNDSVSRLAETDNRLRVVIPGENLGYLGGAQLALDTYLLDNETPDFVIISNPDIRIKDACFVSMLCALESHRVGMIAPTIVSNLTGANQNPYIVIRPTRRKMFLRKCMFSWYPISMFYQGLAHLKAALVPRSRKAVADEEKIYAAHGSFMVFTKKYFKSGGTFQHGAFLFGEEISLAEKTRELNLDVIYNPRLLVHHAEHTTTGVFKSYKMFRYQRKAVQHCYGLFIDKQTN